MNDFKDSIDSWVGLPGKNLDGTEYGFVTNTNDSHIIICTTERPETAMWVASRLNKAAKEEDK